MSFLDNIFGKKEELTKLDAIINNLRENNAEGKYNDLIEYISSKKHTEDFFLFTTDEQYQIINDMARNIEKIQDRFHIEDIVYMASVAVTSNDSEEKNTFFKLVKSYYKNPQLFKDIASIYHVFQNKTIVYVIYNDLLELQNTHTKYIFDYIKEGRQYNLDEGAFSINIRKIIDSIKLIPEINDDLIREIIDKQLKKDMHLISYYDIDEERLVDAEKRYDSVYTNLQNIEDEISNVRKDVNSIQIKTVTVSEQAAKSIQDTVDRETKDFKAQVLSCEKKVINAREELKKCLETAKDEINDAGSFWKNEISNTPIPTTSSKTFNQSPTIITHAKAGTASQTRPGDELILTMDNYERLLQRKNPNELYHESFMELYEHALNKEATMLIGPHGSGKTHSVHQLSHILNLRVYNFGFVADEYSVIKGYMDANGNYVKTLFYEVFKYGGIALFDEVDASESRSLIELNKIICGPGQYEAYSFPNGETVKPHPNFLPVFSSNTWGDGSSRVYSSREKLDPATLDRVEPIVYGYDTKLEREILKKYPDEYEFILSYREALKDAKIAMDISTRGVQAVKSYLDRNVDWKKILDKRFIKNISIDDLNQIIGHMNNCPTKQLDIFKQRVKEKSLTR